MLGMLWMVMNMKGSKDLLSSVLKTTQMGQIGIRSLLNRPVGNGMQKALRSQLDEYSMIEQEAHRLAASRGWELEQLNPAIKYMAGMMTKAQISLDHSDSKAAALMIQGNTRGMIKGFKNLNSFNNSDQRVADLTQKLLSFEEANIRQMQGFL